MAAEEDWTDVEVFADHLQAAGDARGELLALELASERATSSDEARRLNREAQRIRDRHHARVWPAALADAVVDMRAGFVVEADFDAVASPSLPLELLLSLRTLSLGGHRRLEDAAPLLDRARAHGLRLDTLSQSRVEPGPPTNLARLQKIDTLGRLTLAGPVTQVEALAKLARLRSCSFGAPLRQAELCSLAPLQPEHLRLHGSVDPVIVPLFGNTLTSLDLREHSGSLAPLAGLPWLRKLRLAGEPRPGVGAALLELLRLEALTVASFADLDVQQLHRLRLRELAIGVMPNAAVRVLSRLPELESLTIHRTDPGPCDVSPLAELTRLRRLVIRGDMVGHLTLPAGFQRLAVGETRQSIPIDGAVEELFVVDADLRNLPRRLLAEVRSLRLVWVRTTDDGALAELPRLMPKLERLELRNHRDPEWAWPDAPEVIHGLPRLRSLQMGDTTVRELAEIARAFPQLCPLAGAWPRSCGELAKITTVDPRRVEPVVHGEREDFAAAREWAQQLRSKGDVRGELLELELAAELADDPADARSLNAEALELRLAHPRIAWPLPLRNDRALLRGGMPTRSTSGWIDRVAPPLELMRQLRSVHIESTRSLESCIASLAAAEAAGMRLERLWIGERAYEPFEPTRFDLLDRFRFLSSLGLLVRPSAEQRRRFPALPLRHLTMGQSSYDAQWVQRFAATLESLALAPTLEPMTLGELDLPRLERLDLGRGWRADWAHTRPRLRDLGLFCDSIEALDAIAGPGPQQLRLHIAARTIDGLRPRAELSSLELRCSSGRLEHFETAALARMPKLRSLTLTWSTWNDEYLPGRITLVLPPTLTELSLPAIETRFTIRGGSVEVLGCRFDALTQLPAELCAKVRQLTLLDDELTPSLVSQLPQIESVLPRLRTVVLPGFSVGQIAELSTTLPRVQLHPLDPGYRDPDTWPQAR